MILTLTLTRHNNLVLHMRMCDAMVGSIELALQKARGSALFQMPTSKVLNEDFHGAA